jgi:hypothetical protein
VATRPTDKPLFASTASGTDIQQPDSSHQTGGWGFREKPPYEYQNWLSKNYHDWIDWLDQEMEVARTSELNTSFNIVSGGGGTVVESGNKRMLLHMMPGAVKMVSCHCHFVFRPGSADNLFYAYAEIPDTYRPNIVSWVAAEMKLVPAGCIKYDAGVTTDIENIYAGAIRDGSTNKLVFSDKQVRFAEPTAGVFSGSGLISGDGFHVFANLMWESAF